MQSATIPLATRGNLSDELSSSVRDLVLDGALPAGTRVNEVHLAERLGVSRTPLREALNLLVGEGFLNNVPRRGFFVAELSLGEVEDLYQIRALLDPEALRLTGLPSAQRLQRLGKLNDEIADAADAGSTRVIARDDRWHRLLLEGCPNSLLSELIDRQIVRTRRYEHAYLREGHNVAVAVEEHRLILSALARSDLDSACEALRNNMLSAREPLLAWLRERDGDSAGSP